MDYQPTDAQYESLSELVNEKRVIVQYTYNFNNDIYAKGERALACVTQAGSLVIIEPDGTRLLPVPMNLLG